MLAGADGVLARQTNQVQVLLNVRSGHYYSLNEVGARLWELLDGQRAIGIVINQMAEEFDAPPAVISADVGELVEDLFREGLLVEDR